MRILLFLILLFSAMATPVHATYSCTDARSETTVIEDKAISAFDTLMPILFHDPVRTIRFHATRANQLYQTAVDRSKSYQSESVWLAIRAQNQLTLIEESIRQIQNPQDVPYADILHSLQIAEGAQRTLLANLPQNCSPEISQLQSFESRTTTAVKKLYYEGLLP